ncbi:MAG TPA: pyridoxamine 5'-phosphate oxidase family protein [Euzebya sp.]|nr:pyridoxamine 5'-phosphate oxidase family protein [Euzebya sp.]
MTDAPTRSLLELTVEECLAKLPQAFIGRLAYVVEDQPRILPLNHAYDDGTVVFRTGYGPLIDAVHGKPVAYEVDDYDVLDHTGWSVVVKGIAEEVWRTPDLEHVRSLPLRPWAPGYRDHYVRIMPTAITGRRIGRPG